MTKLMPYRTNTTRAMDPFEDFFRPFMAAQPMRTGFPVNVMDEGDHYTLEAEMPGIKKEDLTIEIEDDVLTIKTETNETKEETKDNYLFRERRTGSFKRSFTLEGIDQDNIAAEYTDGILKLTLPKQAEEPKTAKRIAIA